MARMEMWSKATSSVEPEASGKSVLKWVILQPRISDWQTWTFWKKTFAQQPVVLFVVVIVLKRVWSPTNSVNPGSFRIVTFSCEAIFFQHKQWGTFLPKWRDHLKRIAEALVNAGVVGKTRSGSRRRWWRSVGLGEKTSTKAPILGFQQFFFRGLCDTTDFVGILRNRPWNGNPVLEHWMEW